MKKKLFAITIVATMLCMKAVPAMAGTVTSNGNNSQGTNLSYTVSQSYTVTIPESITAGSTGSGTVTLSAGAIIETGKSLKISVNGGLNYSSGYRMKTTNSEYVNYDLFYTAPSATKTKIDTEGTTILTVSAGDLVEKTVTMEYTVTGDPTVAGTFSDTLTFTVAVN